MRLRQILYVRDSENMHSPKKTVHSPKIFVTVANSCYSDTCKNRWWDRMPSV